MDALFDFALAENGRGVLFTQASPIHGHGLFTAIDVAAQTILCRRLGLRSPLSLRDKRAILGIDGFDPATPDDVIFKNINHCCHPNARLTDTGCLVNLAQLSAGTEITVDYNALLPGAAWQTACLCGSPCCCGTIISALNVI